VRTQQQLNKYYYYYYKSPIFFTLTTYSHISDGFTGSKTSQKLKHYCIIILQKLAAAAVDGGESNRSL
jgi:hypothetical protein